VAVVVAHLHCLVVAAPFGPVEHRDRHARAVPRLKAKERCIIHARRVDDFSRIHEPEWVEPGLDLGKHPRELRSEEWRNPFRAHETVAVLARVSALEFLDQRGRLLGDRAHFRRAVASHVEHRPHV
jgi:hypothetical protein